MNGEREREKRRKRIFFKHKIIRRGVVSEEWKVMSGVTEKKNIKFKFFVSSEGEVE